MDVFGSAVKLALVLILLQLVLMVAGGVSEVIDLVMPARPGMPTGLYLR